MDRDDRDPHIAAKTYPDGVPCWIDVQPPDRHGAETFYGELFGWSFANAMPPDAPGYYLIATLDGHDVAAIGMPDAERTDAPAAWNTYVAVGDAEATAASAVAAGARLIAPPADAGPGGRAATLVDPTGAEFRLWQPRRRLGAQLVNAPGAWNFSDLHTGDVVAARAFYGSVFGWEADELNLGDEVATMWRRPGYGDHLASTVDPDIFERQAGIDAPPGFADAIAWLAPLQDGEAPHWHVTFAVADRDDSVETALRLGATMLGDPLDSPWTKAAVVRDPQGAVFTVSQFLAG